MTPDPELIATVGPLVLAGLALLVILLAWLAWRQSALLRHLEEDRVRARTRDEEHEKLERKIADHPARLMLWEGEPLPETALRLEQLGVDTVVVDPCGNRPEEGDWLTTMRANAEALERLR